MLVAPCSTRSNLPATWAIANRQDYLDAHISFISAEKQPRPAVLLLKRIKRNLSVKPFYATECDKVLQEAVQADNTFNESRAIEAFKRHVIPETSSTRSKGDTVLMKKARCMSACMSIYIDNAMRFS